MPREDSHKRLNVWLPKDLHHAAKVKAADTGISMAEICRRALTNWVKTGEMPPNTQEKEEQT